VQQTPAPAGDPDDVTVDSLKALDLNRPIREATVIATGEAVVVHAVQGGALAFARLPEAV
jgi:hypothetical protein